MQSTLKQRAVLMRLSIGLPGENRQDPTLTENVKTKHKLGSRSGRWVKALYPPEALQPIKEIDNKVRQLHAALTLPFDQGIGILPASLFMEYGDRMRDYARQREHLIDSHFLANYDRWVEWAKVQHNGTFDSDQYPGPHAAQEKFYFRTEPLPVPDSAHFENTITSLLGVDAQSIDAKVADAALEAQRELMRRMIDPVRHMVATLNKEKPKIYESMLGNIQEIAQLAPKLNLSGDPTIDQFAGEMTQLIMQFETEGFRESETYRDQGASAAEQLLKKLEGYKL